MAEIWLDNKIPVFVSENASCRVVFECGEFAVDDLVRVGEEPITFKYQDSLLNFLKLVGFRLNFYSKDASYYVLLNDINNNLLQTDLTGL